MTDFERVNNGVAFSTQQLTSTEMNKVRTNGELLWRMQSLRMLEKHVNCSDLDIGASNYFGPLIWNEIARAYIGITGPTGANVAPILLAAGAGDDPVISQLGATAVPSDIAEGSYPHVYAYETTGYHYQVFPSLADATKCNVSSSTDLKTWTTVTSTPSTLTFAPSADGAGCKMSDSVLVVPGSTATGPALLWLSLGAAGVITATAIGAFSGSPYRVVSVATNGTIAIGLGHGSATSGLSCTLAGTITTLSIPTHAAADYARERIAYDARLAKFVRITSGLSAGAYPSNLMWDTSTGASWSATVGWKRLVPSWSTATTLEDFTITADGIWLAIVRTNVVDGVVNHYLLSSIDSGANWQELALGPRRYAASSTVGFQFGSPGPGIIAKRVGAGVTQVVHGGWHTTGTELASVTV
jgi:hypothetical protein